MRRIGVAGLLTATTIALAGCTSGSGPSLPGTGPGTSSASATAQARAYGEDELRQMIQGLKDGDGNELRLYSKDQVAQGSNVASVILSTATVQPDACKEIATAGLLDTVKDGDLAVALSESQQPRTVSAQSGSQGPSAVEVLKKVSDSMDQCATFSVEALGTKYDVSSEELQADTDAEVTFGTLSKRVQNNDQQLMQVSAAEGRLLVVATKSGAGLADQDQKELEDLIDQVLARAKGGTTATAGPATASSSASPTTTATTGGSSATPTTVTPTPSPSATVSR